MNLELNCNNNSHMNMGGSSVNTWVKLNLVDGEGQYSFVQRQGPGGIIDKETNNPCPMSVAKGRSSVSLGIRCKSLADLSFSMGNGALALEQACIAFGNSTAGRTSQEWIDYYWDAESKTAINGGQGLLDVPIDIADYTDKGIIIIDGAAKYVLGPGNTRYGNDLFNPSLSVGQGSKSKGHCSTSIGYKAYAMADYALATGNATQSLAHYGYSGGYITVNNSQYGIVYGYYLESSKDISGQAVFGKYNIKSSEAVLQIGNGNNVNQRSNAFEVLKDGRAKVYGAPIDDNDVIRKCDIVSTSINQEFFNSLYL